MDGSDEELEGDDEIYLEELVNLIDDGTQVSEVTPDSESENDEEVGKDEVLELPNVSKQAAYMEEKKGNHTMSEEEKIAQFQEIGYKHQDITQKAVGISRKKRNSSKLWSIYLIYCLRLKVTSKKDLVKGIYH